MDLPRIQDILSDQDLEKLVAGKPARPEAGGVLVRAYPQAKGFVDAIENAREGAGVQNTLDDREHEIAVLSVLVANDAAASLLAIHIYFALASGMTPLRIANTLLVAGGYAGMPRFVHAMATLEKTLIVLRGLVAVGKTKSEDILPVLILPLVV